MASEAKVQAALEHVARATNHRFFSAKEEASTLKVWIEGLGHYSNEALGYAAEEWAETMVKFPTLVEISTLARSKQVQVDEADAREREARALEAGVGGARPPDRRTVVGKAGSEAIAAQIVLHRMVKAVGELAPQGYFGRLAGLSDGTRPGPGLRESGHSFDVFGRHESGCDRCRLIATVAYEQVVEGPDSTATWEGFEGDHPIDLDALRKCANASCQMGWVSVLTIEDGRLADRLKKCETCGGPQPRTPRAKVMDGEEMVKTTRRKRRAW